MIVLRLIGLLFDLLFLPLRALRRRRALGKSGWVHLAIDGAVGDIVAPPRFWQLRARKLTSLAHVSKIVDALVADPEARGLLVTIRSMNAGMAATVSLRDELTKVRAAGKRLCVHLPLGGGTKETIVASAASTVVLGPRATLAPVGFLSTTHYVKDGLDMVGLEPEVFACGEYKAAGENLTRREMSDAQREQLGAILDAFHATLVGSIAKGRGLDEEAAADVVHGAPYFGAAAMEAKLVDHVAYEDELPAILGLDPKRGLRAIRTADAYLSARTRPLFRRLVAKPVIAVVPVHGPIAHAAGPFGNFATDERVVRMVRLARMDPRVAGVILHVDSPGGSALASDVMHHEIVRLAKDKPVVACMGNVAASGGYYVSAPARRIVCASTTVTGSIGVVGIRIAASGLLARLGVRIETLRRGAHAGLLSTTERLGENESIVMKRQLDAVYDAFLSVVVEGRSLPRERVESLARGRVYTGEAAVANGLADVVGGFDVAVDELRALLPAPLRGAEVVVLRTPRSPIEALPVSRDERPADGRSLAELATALLPDHERTLALFALAGERIVAIAPWLRT